MLKTKLEISGIFRVETKDARLLKGASKLIQKNFLDAPKFSADSLLIVTWDDVGYYTSKADKRNSFQLVVASNDSTSYAAFLYAKIQWIQSEGKETPMRPDTPGQAGFVAADGRHQTLAGSGMDDISELPR